MKKIFFLSIICLLLAACNSETSAPAARPSNVVFILADDLGITDINAYARHFREEKGNRFFHETPHLDRLIREGTAFSQAYATQLCSPTRAGILAGKFAPRLGFMTAMPLRETYYNQGLPVPEGYYAHDVLDHRDKITIPRAWDNATSNSALPTGAAPDKGRDLLSLPEAMPRHEAAFLGKWHIGGFGAAGYQPADHGFMPLAWFDGGGSAYFNWRPGWNRTDKKPFPEMPQPALVIGNAGPDTGEEYLTDDLTAQALAYLEARAGADEKQPFFLYLSHFAVHSPYQAIAEETRHFANKNEEETFDEPPPDPVYAAMLQRLDASVGAILEQLQTSGLAENTLVVFMSDNGGIDRSLTPRGDGTENTPFLGGKACLTEGGIRVPLVIWSQNRKGEQWVDVPVDYTDLYPTILAAAGYDPAPVIREEGLDGRNLLPLLDDPQNADGSYPAKTRYWHYPFNVIYRSPFDGYALTPHSAIREGDQKLIFDWHGRLHLFNLAEDPYESNNLVEMDTLTRDRLFQQLTGWLEENVDRRYWPLLNPEYRPADEVREVPFRPLLERR